MKGILLERTRNECLALGYYQLIGGGVGVGFGLMRFIQNQTTTANLVSISIMLMFFGYSIYCGVACLGFKKNGLRHSLVNQFLQVIGFAVLG
jgi:hypothetical protein